jgi:hypothetical protein
MKFSDNVPKVVESCNHPFSQSIKPPSSMTQGKLCTGVQMTYQQAREKANQL